MLSTTESCCFFRKIKESKSIDLTKSKKINFMQQRQVYTNELNQVIFFFVGVGGGGGGGGVDFVDLCCRFSSKGLGSYHHSF